MNAQELLIAKRGWHLGRMLSGSKTLYHRKYPNNEVYFNANIFNDHQKIWWGDVDITLDSLFLQEVSNKSGENLYILYEMDGRFENEDLEHEKVVEVAKKVFKPQE